MSENRLRYDALNSISDQMIISPSAYQKAPRRAVNPVWNRPQKCIAEDLLVKHGAVSKLDSTFDHMESLKHLGYDAEAHVQESGSAKKKNFEGSQSHPQAKDGPPGLSTPSAGSQTVANPQSTFHKDPVVSARPERFARWRTSRYIPRHLTRIPKEQQKILESPNSWQPPLAGNDLLQGDVPNELFRQLAAFADMVHDKAATNLLTAGDLKEQDNLGCSLDCQGSARRSMKDREKEDAIDDDSSAENISWSSSERSGGSDKQSTPPSQHADEPESSPLSSSPGSSIDHRQELPPSSPLYPVHEGKTNDTLKVSQIRLESQTESQTEYASPTEPETTHVSASERHGNLPSIIPEVSPDAKESEYGLDERRNGSATLVQEAVQVKRTPYPGRKIPVKELEAGKDEDNRPTGVELPLSSFVGGTFNARNADNINAGHGLDVIVEPPNPSTAFEDNSSEDNNDEMLHVQSSGRKSFADSLNLPRTIMGLQQNRTTERHANPQSLSAGVVEYATASAAFAASTAAGGRMNSPAVSQPPENRGVTESSQQSRSQTARLPPPPETTGKRKRSDEVDCEGVEKMIRAYRRDAFAEIGIHPTVNRPGKSQQTGNEVSESARSESEARSRSARSPLSHGQQVSTPPTLASSRNEQQQPRTATLRSPVFAHKNHVPLASVFNRYKQTYPNYNGDLLQFTNACRLIKGLKSEGRAPHSSLWDDFIFRLVLDYQQYVAEVLAAGGSVKEYAVFYEECVEEPEHMKRVVRAADIDSLPLEVRRASSRGSFGYSNPVDDSAKMVQPLSIPSPFIPGDTFRPPLAPTSLLCSQEEGSVALPSHFTAKVPDHAPPASRDHPLDHSVRQWLDTSLDRQAGLSSPELGTPTDQKMDDDVVMLDLTSDEVDSQADTNRPMSSPLTKKRRSLPWNATSFVNTQSPQGASQPPRKKIIQETPRKPSINPPSRSQPSLDNITSYCPQPLPPPHSTVRPASQHSHPKPSSQRQDNNEISPVKEWWQDDATPFKHFMRNFNNFPGEKMSSYVENGGRIGTGLGPPEAATLRQANQGRRNVVDVFAWRCRA